jgi:hypothetical protein
MAPAWLAFLKLGQQPERLEVQREALSALARLASWMAQAQTPAVEWLSRS